LEAAGGLGGGGSGEGFGGLSLKPQHLDA